jgi:hypothetical protein
VAKQTWWEEFNYTEFPLAASKVILKRMCGILKHLQVLCPQF